MNVDQSFSLIYNQMIKTKCELNKKVTQQLRKTIFEELNSKIGKQVCNQIFDQVFLSCFKNL